MGRSCMVVQVQGTIDANVDDANRPVDCSSYVRSVYALDAYTAAPDELR